MGACIGGNDYPRPWRLGLDGLFEGDQLLGAWGYEHHVANRLGNEPRADGANGAGGANHHRPAPGQVRRAHLNDGLLGRLQGGHHRQAVAGGDGNVRLVGNGHASIAHHLGEGAEPHDLGA